jgi:signal transduction histidine kinase
MTQPDAAELPIQPSSLRLKMLLSFGGAVVFTVVLVLFWTYLQFGNLRRDFAVTQARREAVTVLEDLRRHPDAIRNRLASIKPVSGSRYLYVPTRGRAPSLLAPTDLCTIRRNDEGDITLAHHDLAGVYRRISPARPELGSLLVLLPIGATAKVTLNNHVLIFFFLTVLAVALSGVMLTSTDLTNPLVQLEQQAAAMARGKLDLPVIPGGELDEIGRLTSAFDKMRQALRDKIQTIEQLNVGLEQKVRERTAELETSNSELMTAIKALKETQQQLITSEKLASVGQLVAGIAHEINNPINAVINTVKPLSETVEELLEKSIANNDELREVQQDLEAMLRVIRSGTQRTQRIVQALRNYSRQESEERSSMDLHADIEETLSLLQHNLREIEVVRDFNCRGEIDAYRGQLNQALMNLIANAAAALQGQAGARITLKTLDRNGEVEIRVEDNGPGIPPGVMDRIFDPFFTTKEVGQGTGLGLSITYQIVERHGGQISVDSSELGTAFTLLIPRNADPQH